jgi:hypothetical protein
MKVSSVMQQNGHVMQMMNQMISVPQISESMRQLQQEMTKA